MSDEARYWAHPAAPGVNLMQARLVHHAFGRHSHPTFAIGVVQQGVERLRIGDTTELVGPGGLARVNAGGRVFLSSTRVGGRFTVRMCVLSHRTHRDRVEEAVDAVREAAAHVTGR
ncbi:MAG: AraC family ligand binding domain-containing protein [Nocardioidaceae bacterium]